MRSVFRSAICATLTFSNRSLIPNPHHTPLILLSRYVACSAGKFSTPTSMASVESGSHAPPSPTVQTLGKQFDEFRHQLDESGSLHELIRSVASEIESITRMMQSILLLIHQSRPIPEVLQKAKGQITELRVNLVKLFMNVLGSITGIMVIGEVRFKPSCRCLLPCIGWKPRVHDNNHRN